VVLTIKKSEDPWRMIFNWIITAIIIAFIVWKALPLFDNGGMDALICLAYIMAGAIVAIIIWRRSIASLVADPIGSLYDGGSTPPDPHPVYSIAQTRQKQGRYVEAVAEIRKQLDRFPTDVEGQLLLAQIQAEHLKDLPAAEMTIERFCAQSGHAPKNIVFALYSLADWHRGIGQDREAARRVALAQPPKAARDRRNRGTRNASVVAHHRHISKWHIAHTAAHGGGRTNCLTNRER
jgi:hypothetical protein